MASASDTRVIVRIVSILFVVGAMVIPLRSQQWLTFLFSAR